MVNSNLVGLDFSEPLATAVRQWLSKAASSKPNRHASFCAKLLVVHYLALGTAGELRTIKVLPFEVEANRAKDMLKVQTDENGFGRSKQKPTKF